MMNIKSLLLGSATAMVAVSSAQAADAVVVEAEPIEYVRVCDAYGSGYFFIPGTETCIRFGGYVRTQYTKLDSEGQTSGVDVDSTQWSSRINLDVNTRNETDWGTLRSLIRFRSNNAVDDGDGSNFEIDQAFITIAGLRAGIGGSLFNANFSAGTALEGVPQIFEDGLHGFSNGHVLDYTYTIDGLSLTLGLEDQRDGGSAPRGGDAGDVSVLAKAQYSGDFGSVGIIGEFAAGDENDAYKAYATLDISDFVPGGILGGYYMWQDDVTATSPTNVRLLGAKNIYGLGFQMNLTDDVEFIVFYNEADNDTIQADESLTVIGLNWYPVSGVKVFGAYSFGDTVAGTGALVANARGPFASPASGFIAGEEVEYDQFLIGLRRNF